MHRRDGVTSLILAGLVLCAGSVSLLATPLVIGYERFYADAPSIEGGRILFNELGCVNCHDRETGLPSNKGPRLNGILKRNHPEWIRSFLTDPQKTKPGTTMPKVHLQEQEVEAVINYLASQSSEEIPDAYRYVNAERGMSLYHEIGCVACHRPSDKNSADKEYLATADYTYPHIPLLDLKQKYDLSSLSYYLYNTHQFRRTGRMPQFKLDREDGGDLAAFLLEFNNGNAREYPPLPKFIPDPTLAKIGYDVFKARNCQACHNSQGSQVEREIISPISMDPPPLDSLTDHPTYHLSRNQQLSIESFLKSSDSEPVSIQTHLRALNCVACHVRDGSGGPDRARQIYFTGDVDLGDSGRLPPPLTGFEYKLKKDWLVGVLQASNEVRPYLKVQMPNFGDSIQKLLDAIREKEGTEPESEDISEFLAAGQKLLGTQGGLGCITCHDWGDKRSLGVRALDLSTITERLHKTWFHDFLIEPKKYRPGTLMPSFWPNGQASNKDILNGDTKRQIDAIYAFAASKSGYPEGFPDRTTNDFEIVPEIQPIVQRMFVDEVGTNVLLVGFPEGIHLAFNAETGQPALMWKGRFIDAYSTWFSRFPEFEKPLGEEVVKWPEPTALSDVRFRGFRLDENRIPVFLLTLGDSEATERYAPHQNEEGVEGMLRVIRYSNSGQLNDRRLEHPRGVKRKELSDNDPMVRTFFYKW